MRLSPLLLFCQVFVRWVHGRPRLARQLARADFAIAVHQDDERIPALVLHDQRLDDDVLVDAERSRRRRVPPCGS